jgi:hypothetical protein
MSSHQHPHPSDAGPPSRRALGKAPIPTSYDTQAALNGTAKRARVAATPLLPGRTSASLSVRIGQAYERFLEMPVSLIIVVVWFAGAALLGSCVLVMYLVVSALI